MKPKDYCCCAIPMVNAGIYATLIEQFVVAIVVGVLAVATPSIVGASTPSFAPAILAALCFVLAATQILGVLGVMREKPKMYRWYVSLHSMFTSAAFSVAAVWIVMSAVRHSTAKDRCLADFFGGDPESGQGDTLCTIFPWVDVGIMGGLWVILAIFHIYLLVIVSSYGKSQRQDHDDYDQLYNPSQPLTKDNIPLEERKDPWDSRESSDENIRNMDGRQSSHGHGRNISAMSASDVINQPYQRPGSTTYYPGTYTPYSDNDNAQSYPTYANNHAAPAGVSRNFSASRR